MPFGLLLFLFIIDKVSLIPSCYKTGRLDNTPIENISDAMRGIYLDKKKNLDSKKEIIILGTSRSDILSFLDNKSIESNPFIDTESKNMLLNYDFETRSIVKASEFLYHLYLFQTIVESGFKPELVIIEVSPESLNTNNPFHADFQFRTNIFPYRFLLELLPVADNTWRKDLYLYTLFPSVYYKFMPEKSLQKFIKGKDYLSENNVIPAYSFFPTTGTLPANHIDFEEFSFPETEYKKRILEYTEYLVSHNILKDFKISESEVAILDLLLAKIQKSKIPVVFWRPRVHSIYKQKQEESGAISADKIIQDKIEAYGYPYINLQNVDTKCNYYTDSSHISARCSPEIMKLVIEASKIQSVSKF
ncbi:DUF1574 family protein [Leptospira sp. GIMC2001]|uniref:DUF1574 family protein n=1 Tax=Leptospira sp. GIMC2001 TaxID=1513297 RepID=UPI00234BCAB6|nr:DUF1574 family protein [Leptospira sp. GIMC2001]WCL50923.1 DUF1574 family protein [Leptospira sp. GIMC2001]